MLYIHICKYFHYHHFPNLRGNSKCTYIHRFDGRCKFARVESGILSAKSLTGFELFIHFFAHRIFFTQKTILLCICICKYLNIILCSCDKYIYIYVCIYSCSMLYIHICKYLSLPSFSQS